MATFKSNEDYQRELQQLFDELTGEQIVNLIQKCEYYLPQFEEEDSNRDYLISNIVSTCREVKSITFKQWKALSAFVRDCEKKEKIDNKTKSFDFKPAPKNQSKKSF